MPVALTCPWCGAPLPRIDPATTPIVTCAYCASTSSLAGERAAASPGTPAHPGPLVLHLIRSFKQARSDDATPFEALVIAARQHLGPMGETDTFARVVAALATDFDRAHGTKTATEASSLARLAEAYLNALPALRARGSHELELPAFSTLAGTKYDLRRTLTLEDIAALAARPA